MDAGMEGIRGDHRGEDDEDESRGVERDVGSEDTSCDGNEDDEELDDEDPSDDDSIESDVSDDEEDHLEDGDCEDDNDRRIFGGTNISKRDYLYQVLPLKHNDAKMTLFYLWWKDLSNEAWARLGDFLSRNTHLRQIRIISCELTANKLALLFGSGPFQSNLIEELYLCDNPIGSEGVTALKPFFNKASALTELHLSDTNLGAEGLKLLSLELDGLPSLRHLYLLNNNIGDEGLEGISPWCLSRLTNLYLDDNGIGRRGYESIVNLLRSDGSSLVHLDLGGNAMDDGCAEILAGSLGNNKTLEAIGISVGSDNISCVGWESFRRLVCDTSSVSATYGSNHTLRSIGYDFEFGSSPIEQQLERALADNGQPGTLKDKACQKIIKHHFEEGNSAGPLLDMDVKLMPHVFRWMNQRSDEDFGVGCRNNLVYQILRTLNVCAFVKKNPAPPV